MKYFHCRIYFSSVKKLETDFKKSRTEYICGKKLKSIYIEQSKHQAQPFAGMLVLTYRKRHSKYSKIEKICPIQMASIKQKIRGKFCQEMLKNLRRRIQSPNNGRKIK